MNEEKISGQITVTGTINGTITIGGGGDKIDLVINPKNGTSPTAIGDYLFADQTELRSVKINNALSAEGVTVGSYAFAGCTALERVEMPKVEQIKSYAFRYCPVKDYYFGSTGNGGVPILSTVLPGTDDKKIHVPASLEADYKAASGWSQYASIIVGDYNA